MLFSQPESPLREIIEIATRDSLRRGLGRLRRISTRHRDAGAGDSLRIFLQHEQAAVTLPIFRRMLVYSLRIVRNVMK